MKKSGQINGLDIWIPDGNDIVMNQQSFDRINQALSMMFPMVPIFPENCPNCKKDTFINEVTIYNKKCTYYHHKE